MQLMLVVLRVFWVFCFMRSMVVLVLCICMICLNIFLVVFGLSFIDGLFSSIILGLIIRECVNLICFCCLLERSLVSCFYCFFMIGKRFCMNLMCFWMIFWFFRVNVLSIMFLFMVIFWNMLCFWRMCVSLLCSIDCGLLLVMLCLLMWIEFDCGLSMLLVIFSMVDLLVLLGLIRQIMDLGGIFMVRLWSMRVVWL